MNLHFLSTVPTVLAIVWLFDLKVITDTVMISFLAGY